MSCKLKLARIEDNVPVSALACFLFGSEILRSNLFKDLLSVSQLYWKHDVLHDAKQQQQMEQ